MHVALEVAHRDQVADRRRDRKLAVRELVLLPDRAAVAAVELVHGAAVVAHERIARVDLDARERGELARPDLAAVRHLEAGHPPLVGGGAYLAALHYRLADHVGDSLELGGAL